jgi:signal transduction histidine kinase
VKGITTVGNQGEAHVHGAPLGSGSASAGRSVAQSISGFAPGATRPSARARRGRTLPKQLDRLRPRLRDRQNRVVEDALARERRRIAADVHDLVMQDLAFALATARALADEPVHASQAVAVVAAGERALAGARHVVGGLITQDRKPVVKSVEAGVRTAARDTPLSFDATGVPVDVQPDPPTLDALVHIGREAVTNAIKHASPVAIEVALERADEWRLRVRDDGRGFDVMAAGGGFGLQSMNRYAQALGGSLRVMSVPELGTTVEVILP